MIPRRICFFTWLLFFTLNVVLIGVLCVVTELHPGVFSPWLVGFYCAYWSMPSVLSLLLVLEWRDLYQKRTGVESVRMMRAWFVMALLMYTLTFEASGFLARKGATVFVEPLTAALYVLTALLFGTTLLIAIDTSGYPTGVDVVFGANVQWSNNSELLRNESDKQV